MLVEATCADASTEVTFTNLSGDCSSSECSGEAPAQNKLYTKCFPADGDTDGDNDGDTDGEIDGEIDGIDEGIDDGIVDGDGDGVFTFLGFRCSHSPVFLFLRVPFGHLFFGGIYYILKLILKI